METKGYIVNADGCGPSTETRNDRYMRVRNEVIPPPLLFSQNGDGHLDVKKQDTKQLMTSQFDM